MRSALLLEIFLAFFRLCHMVSLQVRECLSSVSSYLNQIILTNLDCLCLFSLLMPQFFLKNFVVKKEKKLMCKSCLDILDCLPYLHYGGLVSLRNFWCSLDSDVFVLTHQVQLVRFYKHMLLYACSCNLVHVFLCTSKKCLILCYYIS